MTDFRKTLCGLIAVIGLVATNFNGFTEASQYLEEADDPLEIVLNNHLASDENNEGDLFSAYLAEDTYLQGYKLPARTKFLGHIEKVKEGRRFHRKGYIALNVDQVVYPNGESLNFVTNENDSAEKKLKVETDPADKKRKYIMVPLSILGFVTPLPIALGARAIVGTVTGLREKEHSDEPMYKRIGRGLYNVTPIPTVKNLVKRQPEATFNAGDKIQLHLPEPMMVAIFDLPNSI